MTKFMESIRESFPLEQNEFGQVPNLPLIHSTSSFNALKILGNGYISVEEDNKIKNSEPHAYFFYGRAAYPIQKGKLPRGEDSYFTVCMLVQSTAVDASYVFPFDTGAFINNLYSPFINEDSELAQFALPSDLCSINEFIFRVFGNHYNYVRGNALPNNVEMNCDTPFELRAYWNMVTNKSAQVVDSRCRTIEVVSTEKIQLDSHKLMAIIMPELLRDKKIVRKFLDDHPDIDIISYPCFFGDTDDSYYGVVREKAYDYLKNKGLLCQPF